MTVIGLDDTDSRERGMCTTYLAARVAGAVEAAGGTVRERLLVRLNPAVEHKTRGNAALAVHADVDPGTAFDLARRELLDLSETADSRTSPGLVVAPGEPGDAPPAAAAFAREAARGFHSLADALELLAELGWRHEGWGARTAAGPGRGRIGALAAVGAARAFDEWTYEHVAYRAFDRCGSPREVDTESVFAAAEAGYPGAWDTVDRAAGEAVCVPNAPGPILYGVRGDDPGAVRAVAAGIDAEPVERTALFRTNQGTDVHLRDVDGLEDLRDGRAYRVTGTVATAPETRRGGHVFFDLVDSETHPAIDGGSASADGAASATCAAFEPTKRFRDRVRALRPGDRVTVCGEVSDGTVKLEKFAVRSLVRTEPATPTCPDCGRSMESAGRDQGYRCRDCATTAPGTVRRRVDRELESGWYEVPPLARRHVAKPLVRGGFDAPVHPER